MGPPWLRLLPVLALLSASCSGDSDGCPGGGCCATSLECKGWESCGAEGRCVAAAACTGDEDCLGEDVCSPNGWCGPDTRFDPRGVVLWGEVGREQTFVGAARLEAPTHILTALWAIDGVVLQNAALDGRGDVVYLGAHILQPPEVPTTTVTRKVKRLVRDPWLFEHGYWRMPEDLEANDVLVPTPACEPVSMVPRPGSADVVYGCPDGRVYAGSTVLAESGTPLAIVGGTLLLSSPFGLTVKAGDLEIPKIFPDGQQALFARARGGGFRVVAWNFFQGVAERWYVSLEEMTFEGRYPPRTMNVLGEERALDASGAAYRHLTTLDAQNALVWAVERCDLGALSCTVAYVPEPIQPEDTAGAPPRRSLYLRPPRPTLLMGP